MSSRPLVSVFLFLLPTKSLTYIILHTHRQRHNLVIVRLLYVFSCFVYSKQVLFLCSSYPSSSHLILPPHTATMIFVGSRPEDVARLAQARRFFILRGIQAITSILFIVCLVNAAVKMRNSGEGVSAKSYAISVAISLSLLPPPSFLPSIYWTGCESRDALLNHSACVGRGV